MKVFVIFDEQGKIRGSVVSDLDNFSVRSADETRVHTFEVSDLDRKDVPAYVRNLHTNFRIEILGDPTLVPRES